MTKQRIDRFLKLMADRGASDLHLSVGRPPIFRMHGRIEPIRYRTLVDQDFESLVQPITPPHLWERYLAEHDVDFAYQVADLARFRVNLSRQERGHAAVLRIIPTRLLTVEQLGLPAQIRRLTRLRSGLVLVTGPTGSGKSTTLSAIIHEINLNRAMHFITIEDPIEFVHPSRRCLISQREVGTHSESFEVAVRSAIREDPDAILVGELRDLETIRLALNAAEMGVLVFATLHTNSAARSMDRMIGVFPAAQQDGVRGTLAGVIKAIVAQQLVPRKAGGRAAAVEILFHTPALSSLIREGKTHQLTGLIQSGRSHGMVAMDDALKAMIERDEIEPLAGLDKAQEKDSFRKWLQARAPGISFDTPTVETLPATPPAPPSGGHPRSAPLSLPQLPVSPHPAAEPLRQAPPREITLIDDP